MFTRILYTTAGNNIYPQNSHLCFEKRPSTVDPRGAIAPPIGCVLITSLKSQTVRVKTLLAVADRAKLALIPASVAACHEKK